MFIKNKNSKKLMFLACLVAALSSCNGDKDDKGKDNQPQVQQPAALAPVGSGSVDDLAESAKKLVAAGKVADAEKTLAEVTKLITLKTESLTELKKKHTAKDEVLKQAKDLKEFNKARYEELTDDKNAKSLKALEADLKTKADTLLEDHVQLGALEAAEKVAILRDDRNKDGELRTLEPKLLELYKALSAAHLNAASAPDVAKMSQEQRDQIAAIKKAVTEITNADDYLAGIAANIKAIAEATAIDAMVENGITHPDKGKFDTAWAKVYPLADHVKALLDAMKDKSPLQLAVAHRAKLNADKEAWEKAQKAVEEAKADIGRFGAKREDLEKELGELTTEIDKLDQEIKQGNAKKQEVSRAIEQAKNPTTTA